MGWTSFLMAKKPLPDGVKIAAMGPSTAETIRKYNVDADFVGGNDVKQTAMKFAEVAKSQKGFVSTAKESMRTVQQHLMESEVEELIVYETIMITEH